MTDEETGLVGHFFHTFTKHDDGCETIAWQGHVVTQVDATHYLVELFSWLMGDPTSRRLVGIDEMSGWQFYDSSEWMNNTYKHGGWDTRSEAHVKHEEEARDANRQA